MHLEHQQLLQENPDIASRLETFPASMFSGRKRPAKGTTGVFFCYRLPALDPELNEFTEDAGITRWYFYDLALEAVLEELSDILENVRSKPNTPRKCSMEEKTLVDVRADILKHIKNSYLKRVDAPVGVKPVLKCWMELTNG